MFLQFHPPCSDTNLYLSPTQLFQSHNHHNMRRFVPSYQAKVASPPVVDGAQWGRTVRFFNKQRSSTTVNPTSTGSASSSPSLLQRLPLIGIFFGGGSRISRGNTKIETAAKTFVDPVRKGFNEAVGTSKDHRSAYHTFLFRMKQGGHTHVHFALTNMGGLATYQLILEGGITLLVFTGLYTCNFTPSGLRRFFEDKLHIPTSWVGIEGSEFETDKPIYLWRKLGMYSVDEDATSGSKSVVRVEERVEPLVVLPKELLTQLYMGHNIAVLLMPLQIPFLFLTYPLVAGVWRNQIFPRINSIPFVRQLFPRLGADEAVVTPIMTTTKPPVKKQRGYALNSKIHAQK